MKDRNLSYILKHLTVPGSFGDFAFLIKDGERYNNYYSLLEENRLGEEDILTIRDLLYFQSSLYKTEKTLWEEMQKDNSAETKEILSEEDSWLSKRKTPVKNLSDLLTDGNIDILIGIFKKDSPDCSDIEKIRSALYNNFEASTSDKSSYNSVTAVSESIFSNKKLSGLEKYLIDLFSAKNLGSLTLEFKDYDFEIKDFENLFSELGSDIFTPVVYFEKEGKTHTGFQKYIKSACILKEKIKERTDINRQTVSSINTDEISAAIIQAINEIKGNRPCEEQINAVACAMANRSLSVITGGPGTGKTTVIFSLINALKKYDSSLKGKDIRLLAPTGKAAIRIKDQVMNQAENTGDKDFYDSIESSTMHKFLGSFDLKPKTAKNRYKLIVVDEVSMVDIYLMAAMFLNTDKDTRLVLVGDYNQLPSVDAGCVMADLSRGSVNPYCKDIITSIMEKAANNKNFTDYSEDFRANLKINHRSGNDELKNAFIAIENVKDISGNIKPWTGKYEEKGAFFKDFRDIKEAKTIIEDYLENAFFSFNIEGTDRIYTETVRDFSENADFDSLNVSDTEKLNKLFSHINRFKILCPKKQSIFGCNYINREFVKKYNSKQHLQDNGMPLMITKNHKVYSHICNGDIGIILWDRNRKKRAVFPYKKEYRAYLLSEFEFYDYAFAMTIHKSQGSEYENILIPLDNDISSFMSKQLIYTAVTRAKNSFVILGSPDSVNKMCRNELVRQNAIDLLT